MSCSEKASSRRRQGGAQVSLALQLNSSLVFFSLRSHTINSGFENGPVCVCVCVCLSVSQFVLTATNRLKCYCFETITSVYLARRLPHHLLHSSPRTASSSCPPPPPPTHKYTHTHQRTCTLSLVALLLVLVAPRVCGQRRPGLCGDGGNHVRALCSA